MNEVIDSFIPWKDISKAYFQTAPAPEAPPEAPPAEPEAPAPPPAPSPHADARLAGGAWLASPAAPDLAPFFRALALCHTVIPEAVAGGGGGEQAPSVAADPAAIRYQAASPDEAALVSAARDAGFALLARPPGAITLLEPGESGAPPAPVTYDVLAVLEFSAARRRQSVLVRRRGSPPAADALLLTKGADTTIEPLLDRGDPAATRHWPATAAHLAGFGGAGLRTLCVAGRAVPAAEVGAWLPRFTAARAALAGRDAAIEAAADAMEVGLHLLGSTGIEDRLQDVSTDGKGEGEERREKGDRRAARARARAPSPPHALLSFHFSRARASASRPCGPRASGCGC